MNTAAMYDLAERAAREMERGDDHDEARAIRQLIAEHKALSDAAPVVAAVKQYDPKPEYKTITDHNGRITGAQMVNADKAPPYSLTPLPGAIVGSTTQPCPQCDTPAYCSKFARCAWSTAK